MPALSNVVEFPSHLANAPRCSQCRTPMTICWVEPDYGDPPKNIHIYQCKTCGLLDKIVTEDSTNSTSS